MVILNRFGFFTVVVSAVCAMRGYSLTPPGPKGLANRLEHQCPSDVQPFEQSVLRIP
jgi:hypothetical protein